jgi:hypothetical protein
MSDIGIRLEIPVPLENGTLLRVEAVDRLMLGEVCRSAAFGDHYHVGLMLSHSLPALTDLQKLNWALSDEEQPVEGSASFVPARRVPRR